MKCPMCQKEMEEVKKDYLYLESGLDNVIIENMPICVCECREELVFIKKVPELHNLIGRMIIEKGSLLNGKEIRFLRKDIGLKAKDLADIMGISKETLSRWENDSKNITKPHDELIRLIYCVEKGIKVNIKDFIGIAPELKEMPIPIHIPAGFTNGTCSTGGLCTHNH